MKLLQQMPSWILNSLVAGALSERIKMFHDGSFLKLADDNKYIKNPEAQNRAISIFEKMHFLCFYIIGV